MVHTVKQNQDKRALSDEVRDGEEGPGGGGGGGRKGRDFFEH